MDGLRRRTGVLAALAGLELVTVARLRVLLAHHDAEEAYAVAAGRAVPHPAVAPMLAGDVGRAWAASAGARDPAELAARCARVGIHAVVAADADYPEMLRSDPQPPAVLFFRGSWDTLAQRTAGIVGTRNATLPGRDFAALLGEELAAAGVGVVSGLAKGIDGAAHRGSLRTSGGAHPDGVGRPIGVVANGLDTPYPRVHGDLWEAVARRGLLVSEWPPGTEPERFRFPLRNRLLAAFSEVVVVVESRERGGSLSTAREALERSIDVMAVPGSVHSRAAAGTNQLLRDGAAPVVEPADVLLALGIEHRHRLGEAFDPRPLPRGSEAVVLDRCRTDPCTIEHIVTELGLSLTDAAMALARLERSGWVRESGGWFEEVVTCAR